MMHKEGGKRRGKKKQKRGSNVPVLLVPPEVVEVATRSSEPSEFCGGVGVGSGGGPFTGGKLGGGGGGCCISGPAG